MFGSVFRVAGYQAVDSLSIIKEVLFKYRGGDSVPHSLFSGLGSFLWVKQAMSACKRVVDLRKLFDFHWSLVTWSSYSVTISQKFQLSGL